MKVSDKMFEGGKYPFSCSIYDGYGLCIYTEYKQFVPWQSIDCNCQIPSYKLYKTMEIVHNKRIEGICFSYSMISVYLSLG